MNDTQKEMILLGLFFVVAVNEDSAVLSGALLSYQHVFPSWQPFVTCFLGMWMSDFAVYALSRFGGQRVLGSRWMRRFLSPSRVQHSSILFERYGGLAVVFSRFVLGTRTALLVASGFLRYPAPKFLAVTFAGAAGWLLLIYSLFNFFGLATTFVFGLRWLTALAALLIGGATTVLVAARSRKQSTSSSRLED
jgi:membrane protein DedA with SNARE-associated domain